ncbi:hypothetical protein GXB81_14660 [Paraburkholderia sp. Ac-20336]|uniref:hypothetical protein n=1 Tax=Burkholderiaceae TaxID=119060 RepID=UPI001423F8D4|nr:MULTISPECIES: hypothetical protein [Burkholderiaceae]MBN3804285.1 hypothetical protein [Paraburkholderia sp. Ac-20336]NIF52493.1 hypothetical protein [Burkholderia sp. Ax-1724]
MEPFSDVCHLPPAAQQISRSLAQIQAHASLLLDVLLVLLDVRQWSCSCNPGHANAVRPMAPQHIRVSALRKVTL